MIGVSGHRISLLVFLCCGVAMFTGCASSPEQRGRWIGRASPVVLQDKASNKTTSLAFEITKGDVVSDPMLTIAVQQASRDPVLVNSSGRCMSSSSVPTNQLLWINGELGVRRWVKVPNGEAAFFEPGKMVQYSLSVKSWGVVEVDDENE